MQNITTSGIPKKGLPEGFVYIDELIEDCIIDAKYFGTDNFVGEHIDGYNQPLVIVAKEVAQGLVKAADVLRQKGYILKIFDSYRPQRAVDHFVRWSKTSNQRRKHIHFPNVDKNRLFSDGYVAEKSGHTRGCAVDLTLVDVQTYQELDMGSIFDFMDLRSHHGAAGLTAAQQANRDILKDAMCANGFKLYKEEWWHYIANPEPYPDTYFDFPIE